MKKDFQDRVEDWFIECFGEEAISDTRTRTHRFLEESLELAQAAGCTKEEALRLVDYVYSRKRGVIAQEIGDTFIYLDLLAQRLGLNIEDCIRNTFNRISEREGFSHRL